MCCALLGEDGAAGTAEAAGFVLDDVFTNESQFEAVLHTLKVLLGSGQPQEAQQLTDDVFRLFSKRGSNRCWSCRYPGCSVHWLSMDECRLYPVSRVALRHKMEA